MAKPTGNPNGRPPKPVDWAVFEQLCNIQCTHDEIASFFHIAKATLYEKVLVHYNEDFPTIYKRYSEGGKSSLRRRQYKLSEKNTSMAIWLGKQWLGQSDEQAKSTAPNHEFISSLLTYIHKLKGKIDMLENPNSEEKKDLPLN